MKTAAEFDALVTMIRKNEGVRNMVYKDSMGIPTIGVGFNLHRSGAQERLDEVGVKLRDLLNGAFLQDTAINWLLRKDLDDALEDVRSLIPDFDEMLLPAQLVIVDLRFNLGPARFRGFNSKRGTLEAFRARDYGRAAGLLKKSLWAAQVGKRAECSIRMLEQIA